MSKALFLFFDPKANVILFEYRSGWHLPLLVVSNEKPKELVERLVRNHFLPPKRVAFAHLGYTEEGVAVYIVDATDFIVRKDENLPLLNWLFLSEIEEKKEQLLVKEMLIRLGSFCFL